MNAFTAVVMSSLAIAAAAGQTLAEGEPKSRTECADMKEMTWDSATQTCNPMKSSTDGAVDPPVASPPSNSAPTADRATQTPRAPDEMKK